MDCEKAKGLTSEEAASDFVVGLEVSQGQSFGPGLFYIFSSDHDG